MLEFGVLFLITQMQGLPERSKFLELDDFSNAKGMRTLSIDFVFSGICKIDSLQINMLLESSLNEGIIDFIRLASTYETEILDGYSFSNAIKIFTKGCFNFWSQIILKSCKVFSACFWGNFCHTTNMAAKTNMESKDKVTPVYFGVLKTLLKS